MKKVYEVGFSKYELRSPCLMARRLRVNFEFIRDDYKCMENVLSIFVKALATEIITMVIVTTNITGLLGLPNPSCCKHYHCIN